MYKKHIEIQLIQIKMIYLNIEMKQNCCNDFQHDFYYEFRLTDEWNSYEKFKNGHGKISVRSKLFHSYHALLVFIYY